mgnify:FL=1
MKLNILDRDGFYIEDYIEGYLSKNWTADLVGDGYYKAQYKDATVDSDTGEWTGGHWVETSGPPPIKQDGFNKIDFNINKKARLMSEASAAIAPLQDAVDLNIDTDYEIALLNEWKKYRVKLNRLDVASIFEIDWPEIPVKNIAVTIPE